MEALRLGAGPQRPSAAEGRAGWLSNAAGWARCAGRRAPQALAGLCLGDGVERARLGGENWPVAPGASTPTQEAASSRLTYPHRSSFVSREDLVLKERESRLQVDRALHLKLAQRLESAERSNFRNYPLLAEERYQLLNMIGRGGFSEAGYVCGG